jgi:hypothetical protein
MSSGRGLTALIALALLAGCTKSQLIDFTMSSARHQPTRVIGAVGPYQVLAGDMHCHILPPDSPYHVSRELPETLELAKREGLDFVVLTPHVNGRFFLDADRREWVLRTQRELRERIAARAPADDVLVIPGMEYTDYLHGHVGLAFADVERVLESVSVDEANAAPERFFEVWRAMGGTATIHHPFLTPLPKAPIAELHYDLSWRAFHEPVHPGMTEIHWLTKHADAIETWNESIGHVRDRWFVGDPDWEMRQASHLVDRLAREELRPIASVGGSDSHDHWLRPTTWVLAKEKSAAGIRDAIVHARTCAHLRARPRALHARSARRGRMGERGRVDRERRSRDRGARARPCELLPERRARRDVGGRLGAAEHLRALLDLARRDQRRLVGADFRRLS